MTEADVSVVMDMWARESAAAGIDLPWNDIETALALLPKPEARAVSDDPTRMFLLGPADVIFTVSAVRPCAGMVVPSTKTRWPATKGTRVEPRGM